jgi:hypothetical protein
MDRETHGKPSVTFWIVKFPNLTSVMSDVLTPSSPYSLAAAIEFGELKLGDIHSFHAQEEQAIEVASELMKSSVNYYLGIADDV